MARYFQLKRDGQDAEDEKGRNKNAFSFTKKTQKVDSSNKVGGCKSPKCAALEFYLIAQHLTSIPVIMAFLQVQGEATLDWTITQFATY